MPTENEQVERNYNAFERMLPNLLQSHLGQFALMHDEKVVDYFESAMTAVVAGAKRFGQGRYSVQEVTGQPEDLGFYSYAGGALRA